jgi:predicted Na+-dependent transporter
VPQLRLYTGLQRPVSDERGIAWLVAIVITTLVMALFLRRSAPLSRSRGRYRLLEWATLIATALAAGAMMGLVAYLVVSSLGR